MKVAVLGATGAVGRTMLRLLEERRVPVEELRLLASRGSAGSGLRWGGRRYALAAPAPGCFEGIDVALFSAGAELSLEWAPPAAAEGAVVVDNSSAWRMDPEVPLVVPEVNGERAGNRRKGIIANPNCSTIQTVMALKPIHDAAGLARVLLTTFQSVSGAGQKGVERLRAEQREESAGGSPFGAPIAGNLIPAIGELKGDGWTEEECKMARETRKILELPELPVAATCVRVPVEVGHAVQATVETERELSLEEALKVIAAFPGLRAQAGGAPTPRELAGTDTVAVGRVRRDRDLPRTLHLWIVADNLRKGAATNAVQIVEGL
ncbi:MAG: aspartate-semialdehyde dehydrogenase [Longimicrobiaceae bacterium]